MGMYAPPDRCHATATASATRGARHQGPTPAWARRIDHALAASHQPPCGRATGGFGTPRANRGGCRQHAERRARASGAFFLPALLRGPRRHLRTACPIALVRPHANLPLASSPHAPLVEKTGAAAVSACPHPASMVAGRPHVTHPRLRRRSAQNRDPTTFDAGSWWSAAPRERKVPPAFHRGRLPQEGRTAVAGCLAIETPGKGGPPHRHPGRDGP